MERLLSGSALLQLRALRRHHGGDEQRVHDHAVALHHPRHGRCGDRRHHLPPGECPQGSLLGFTGTATDATFDATVDFALCPTFTVSAVRACPACDDGNVCTTDGCGATPCSAPGSSCTGAFVPDGTPCIDGLACTTGDVCQSGQCAGAVVQCNDNNPCTDEFCDASTGQCVFTPNSAPCNDGNLCTTSDTCTGGTCVGGPALACPPCETCGKFTGCVVAPKPMCRASLGKAKLQLRDGPDDARDTIKWKWGRGAATTAGDFGNPVGADDYTLCVFDGPPATRRLFLDLTAPADGTCDAGGSCWTGRGTPPGAKGFVYKDSRILTPDGVKRVQLTPGLDGRAKASVAGAGPNLDLPSPMNVALPVVVQLQGENGACFESVFTTAKVDVEDVFKAATSPSAAFLDVP